jgi:transposase-like protein
VSKGYRNYNQDAKAKAMEMFQDTMITSEKISVNLGIPRSTVAGWRKTYRATAEVNTPQPIAVNGTSIVTLMKELESIKEDLLDIATSLDENIKYLNYWDEIDKALSRASVTRNRLEAALAAKITLENRLIERAMVVHSTD